jgi:hypothetical protein
MTIPTKLPTRDKFQLMTLGSKIYFAITTYLHTPLTQGLWDSTQVTVQWIIIALPVHKTRYRCQLNKIINAGAST